MVGIEGGGRGLGVVFAAEDGDIGREDGQEEKEEDGDFRDVEEMLVVQVVCGGDGGEERE